MKKKFIAFLVAFSLILPASLSTAAGTDVFTPQSVITNDIIGSGTLGSLNSTVNINPNGHTTVNISIPTGLFGTVVPEVTVDGTNYFPEAVLPLNGGTTTQSITTSGVWSANVAGFAGFRLRVSAYTSGSVVATIREGVGNSIINCVYNCTTSSTYTAPKVKLSIGLGFASGTVNTSIQYPVQPVPAYTNGQIVALRAAGSTTDNGTTVFTVYKNGISIGTLAFTNGTSIASVTLSSPVPINAGDVLTLQCTTSGTIQNVGVVAEGEASTF